MTSREAIEHIKYVRSFGDWDAEEYEALSMAIKIFKKQIPTKPINTNDNGTGKRCVNCGETLLKNWKPNYCMHCGQAIDWSSGDEDD